MSEPPTAAKPINITATESARSVERSYELRVNKEQNDRAVELKLLSFQRPHMQSFHAAWCYNIRGALVTILVADGTETPLG